MTENNTNRNMNRNLVMTAVALLLLTSCTGQSKYEKAIADFVQTDRKGTWTDLQFKVIEMGEPTNITVGDSVAILTEKFDAEKDKRMASLKESIARNKASMEKERFATMKQFYQKLIDKNQVVVDSLAKTSVELPEAYKNVAATTVLAKEVVCKFSIVNPMMGNAKQEITETFILNAAGDKCYRRNSKKKR